MSGDARALRVLGLGVGVQSSALYLMALAGEVEPFDCAIFADTQNESAKTYEYLDYLRGIGGDRIPIHVVTRGNLMADYLAQMEAEVGDQHFAAMPLYLRGDDGSAGMLRRQCTHVYKVLPIEAKLRELCGREKGARAGRRVIHARGISLDEAHRGKPSTVGWIDVVYPLVDLRLTRGDCVLWFERHGYEKPPKSACKQCMYRNNRGWREMRDTEPGEWAEVVGFDAAVRRVPGIRGETFVHAARVPLPMVDLSVPEDRGQLSFLADCEGLCGV